MTTRAARKAKGIYGKWKYEDLKLALAAVDDGVGVNESARMHNIPKTTLKRHISTKATTPGGRIGHPMDLPRAVENDLVQHLMLLEKMFYG